MTVGPDSDASSQATPSQVLDLGSRVLEKEKQSLVHIASLENVRGYE